MTDDAFLQDKNIPSGKDTSDTPVELEKPKNFTAIPLEVFDVIDSYHLACLRQSNSDGAKHIKVREILLNTKYMFQTGRNYDNMWIQHTASSVRELCCWLDIQHMQDSYVSLSHLNPDLIQSWSTYLNSIKNFLSSLVHHKHHNLVGHFHKAYPDLNYGNKSPEVFYENIDKHLEKACIDLTYFFYEIYLTHVKT